MIRSLYEKLATAALIIITPVILAISSISVMIGMAILYVTPLILLIWLYNLFIP